MMFLGFNLALIVSAVVLWQMISISYAASRNLKDTSEIFRENHRSVVTVVTDGGRGTGFSIDPQEYQEEASGKTIRFVITAFHVVKGARWVHVGIYENEKNSEGDWKYDVCPADVHGLDVVRDVAVLAIPCDNCSCKRLGALPTRFSTVNAGESILIIGDSGRRRYHSVIDGKLSDTNYTFPLMHMLYEQGNGVKATTRVHGLTGVANEGDSGSPVMDATGKVIGMMSAISGDLSLCITMEEVSKAKKHILNRLIPLPVGCTAHESALLGRVYWGERSGKSIVEMDALATAMNAQYFAVAHEAHGVEAHAFTFHVLWWEIFLGSEHLKENISQCLCKANSFIDSHHALHTKDGLQVACGCSENACRNKNSYRKRFGEDNDRRWAIYKAMNSKSGKNGHYVPSKESLALMKNIKNEMDYWKGKAGTLDKEMEKFKSEYKNIKNERDYWKGKAGTLDKEMEEFKSEYKFNFGVVIAVLCICATIIIWLHNRCPNTARQLKEATRKLEEATHNSEEATHNSEEATHNSEEATHKLEEATHNSEEATHNSEEATRKLEEATHNSEEATHNSEEATHNSEEATHNSEEETHNSEEVTHNSEEVTQKSEEATQKSKEATQKSEEATQKSEEATQKSEEATQKSEEATQKSEEATQKSEEATQKSEEPTQKSEETTRKLEEANKECEDLKEQQQQQQVPENLEAANLNMAEETTS